MLENEPTGGPEASANTERDITPTTGDDSVHSAPARDSISPSGAEAAPAAPEPAGSNAGAGAPQAGPHTDAPAKAAPDAEASKAAPDAEASKAGAEAEAPEQEAAGEAPGRAGSSRNSRRRGRRGQGRGKRAAEAEAGAEAEVEAGAESEAGAQSGTESGTGEPAAAEVGTGKPRRRKRAVAAAATAGDPTGPAGDTVAPPRGPAAGTTEPDGETGDEPEEEPEGADGAGGHSVTKRRRRRRRRKRGGGGDSGAEAAGPDEDGVVTIVKVRDPQRTGDEVRGVTGSTRLEAKRQRRRGGRDQRRSRTAVLTEAEFLARREAVDRVMVIRQPSRTGRGRRGGSPGPVSAQIAVLEDGVLVEHYVSRPSVASMVGSVHLGKVQNVLPSMEAAFVDVGRGRNAVLYAGEVNWEATGLEGKARSIEQALNSGDSVLVQVTKDPVGHKGARLTSNIALSGRHLVYTPYGNASGISRKLPDNERRRLRDTLKGLVPDGAGVIVRTAAERATTDDLSRDVKRLQAQWDDIQAKAAGASAPALLYAEPDLVVRVVRDLFNEDFRELVIEGEEVYETVEAFLSHVAPNLVSRLRRHTGKSDVFAAYRVDEQILKGLDRKVFLPSGGHVVFDRTEAMTVIDVNTGKYTGAGGNLEETVTRNNLEAAEEIVRQLRLRDIGGIIVIDFIDMVLESNQDLVLRRLTECLGRDRTKHQVTEITSLGLIQMTRKRMGAGLLETFSQPCDCCKGRGVVVHSEPVLEPVAGNGAAERVKEIVSAGASPPPAATRATSASASASTSTTGGRRRSRKAAGGRGRPAAEPTPEPSAPGQPAAAETTGTAPAVPAADEPPAAPDGAPAPPLPDGAPAPEGQPAPPFAPVDPATDAASTVDEAGIGGVLRRFRRRGGRHRSRKVS